MESKEKTYLIRKFERHCKQYYIQVGLWGSQDPRLHRDYYTASETYFLIRDICLDLKVLTEEQIEEQENHMKEQYDKTAEK